MAGLSSYNPIWEQARAGTGEGRVYEDNDILIASDFESGNGAHIRRLGEGYYAIRIEPEPGSHVYGGKAYYFCFGLLNKRPEPRAVRVRLEADWGQWGERTKHVVLRRAGAWSQLDPAAIHEVEGQPDMAEVDLTVPGAGEPDPVLFASNFHWWPYSEMVAYRGTLRGVQVREIGRSAFQNRAIYAVELGRPDAPCIVNTQTSQPSEMGSLACKAMIDFLLSNDPEAASIRERFRVCFVPMVNPDGTVLGYGVSDAQGRFPFFEGHLAAQGDPNATPETAAVWRYLAAQRPLLFWEWHSNNWAVRRGQMLIRYAHDLIPDPVRRAQWERLEEELLTLPETYHENWTTPTEGWYQNSIGFQAVTRLGAIACMIKQHDRFPLEQSRAHAVACLKVAARVLGEGR